MDIYNQDTAYSSLEKYVAINKTRLVIKIAMDGRLGW